MAHRCGQGKQVVLNKRIVIFVAMLMFAGCGLIDDDLSVCGIDCRIDYEMRLVMDIHLAIETELYAEEDQPLADALEKWLEPVFTATTNDVELCFYSDDESDELREHSTQQVNTRRSSFTFYLPRENYMHLAAVNANKSGSVLTLGNDHSATMRLATADADTLPSQPAAIYTARCPIVINDQETQTFEVSLYTASSAVALVLNSAALQMQSIEVLLGGTASGFAIKDSVFSYSHQPLVRLEQVVKQCYAAVSLPSRDSLPASAPERTQVRQADADALWQLIVHVTLPDGKVTETMLSISDPLRAGEVEIIRCAVQDDGSLLPVGKPGVGASITLDWKSGGDHEIDI